MIDRIERFIRGDRTDDFGTLALALHRWQVEVNRDYACFVHERSVDRWVDIPAVPVALFRDLPLTSFPYMSAKTVFRTSGTTGKRGVVRLRDTRLYDLGARLHAEAVLGALPTRGISLAPVADDSSLAHMCRDLVPEMPEFFRLDQGVDVEGAWSALRAATEAVFVPGTAFAFADLLEGFSGSVRLPAGSVIMVTGGFKGRRVALSAAELTHRLRDCFPTARVVGEYGMSELSSQLWSPVLGEPFVPPPWLGVVACDPDTAAPNGGVGVLKFVDLASIWTVCAIETRDLGQVLEDGRVVLHGRLEGDQPRGCSLTVEEVRLRRGRAEEHAERGDRPGAPAPAASEQMPDVITDAAAVAGDVASLSEEDAGRVQAVMRALRRLRRVDVGPLSMGLHPDNARQALGLAVGAIRPEGLAAELALSGRRPATLSIVVPWGVFTTPIEWTALYAAGGIAVTLKAPTRDPAFCFALAGAFQAEGLPVTVSTERALGSPDAVVAFGDDETVAQIAAATPNARHALFGHRFSIELVRDDPAHASAIAWDHLLYDTRGCMAPSAVFVENSTGNLFDALQGALRSAAAALPCGTTNATLGPEVRRRVGLARALGRVVEGADWRVLELPAEYFSPVALPRTVVLHQVDDGRSLRNVLGPWQEHLSSVATDDSMRQYHSGPEWGEVFGWFHRIEPIGRLQRPAFPRRHDGVAMLGAVLGS